MSLRPVRFTGVSAEQHYINHLPGGRGNVSQAVVPLSRAPLLHPRGPERPQTEDAAHHFWKLLSLGPSL